MDRSVTVDVTNSTLGKRVITQRCDQENCCKGWERRNIQWWVLTMSKGLWWREEEDVWGLTGIMEANESSHGRGKQNRPTNRHVQFNLWEEMTSPGGSTHPLTSPFGVESSEDEDDMATQQYVIQEIQDSHSADQFTAAWSKKWLCLFESSKKQKKIF